MGLTVSLVSARERADAAALWSELESRQRRVPVAVSWEWTECWLRHYGDVVAHAFVVVRRGPEAVGVALLTRSESGPRVFPLRRLHLGTAGEPESDTVFVEYNDVLCAPEDRREVAAAVARRLAVLPHWDEFVLDGFVPETADALGQTLSLDERKEPSWTIRLRPGTPVVDTLGRSTRRLIRQAAAALAPGRCEVAGSAEHALDILDELAALHQQRWTAAGQPGAFASTRRQGFVRDVLAALVPTRRALAFRLCGPDGTLGCAVGWVEDGRFLYYCTRVDSGSSRTPRSVQAC